MFTVQWLSTDLIEWWRHFVSSHVPSPFLHYLLPSSLNEPKTHDCLYARNLSSDCLKLLFSHRNKQQQHPYSQWRDLTCKKGDELGRCFHCLCQFTIVTVDVQPKESYLPAPHARHFHLTLVLRTRMSRFSCAYRTWVSSGSGIYGAWRTTTTGFRLVELLQSFVATTFH